MDKIKWCLNAKNGIELIEPNKNLAEAYLKKAEEALESMRLMKSKDWKISTAYYAMYFSVYSILMRSGVKCEIHSCTIEFMQQFLKKYFTEEECAFLPKSMHARVDAQYYTNKDVSDDFCEKMQKHTPEFIVKCKSIVLHISEKEVNEIRENLIARSRQ